MILDARSLPDGRIVKTDICIVGAGVAGIVLAREFRGLGMSVAVLESGGLQPDRTTQSLYWGESVGYPYFPLDLSRASGFGGSSNRWSVPIGKEALGVRLRALDEIDFEEREWVPFSGWPFNKSHLDPYYERAHSVCHIGPYTYDAHDWEESVASRALPFASDRVRTTIFQFGSRDIFIKEYKEELARSENVTLYTNSNAVEILTNRTSTAVTGIRFACLNGKGFNISARLFVLAMGAIEIPRLLLFSSKNIKCGLGNENDVVGRFFMEHIHLWSGTLVPSRSDFVESTMLYRIHTSKGIPVMGKLTLSADVLRGERLLNYCVSIHPHESSRRQNVSPRLDVVSWPLLGQAESFKRRSLMDSNFHKDVESDGNHAPANIIGKLARKSVGLIERLKNRNGRTVFRLNHMTEQAPNPDSRVTLSDEKDVLGRPRARLDWRLSSLDVQSIISSQKIIDHDLRASGLGYLMLELDEKSPSALFEGGWHHMGTTRMQVDPKKGVVDSDCRVHGLPNLFIAGPSVFPTGGCANPVLTIVALSLRIADHIKRFFSRL